MQWCDRDWSNVIMSCLELRWPWLMCDFGGGIVWRLSLVDFFVFLLLCLHCDGGLIWQHWCFTIVNSLLFHWNCYFIYLVTELKVHFILTHTPVLRHLSYNFKLHASCKKMLVTYLKRPHNNISGMTGRAITLHRFIDHFHCVVDV